MWGENFLFPVLPMILLGYSLNKGFLVSQLEEPRLPSVFDGFETQSPLYAFCHQFGGLYCDHLELMGAFLPLTSNLSMLAPG